MFRELRAMERCSNKKNYSKTYSLCNCGQKSCKIPYTAFSFNKLYWKINSFTDTLESFWSQVRDAYYLHFLYNTSWASACYFLIIDTLTHQSQGVWVATSKIYGSRYIKILEKDFFLGKCVYENETNSFKNIYEGVHFY